MLSFELINYTEYCLTQLGRLNKTLEPLRQFASRYQELLENVGSLILSSATRTTSGNGTSFSVTGTHNEIADFERAFDAMKSNFCIIEFLPLWNDVKNNLEKYQEENGTPDTFFSEYTKRIDSTLQFLQEYYQQPTKNKRNNLSNTILSLMAIERYTIAHYEQTLSALANYQSQDESLNLHDNQLLTIQLLGTQLTVDEFSEALAALNNLYNCFSRFSEGSTQLEIIKIESGSLLSKLLGDKNIIAAIGNLLNKFVEWFFRKYTYDGQLARASDTVKALGETFEFAQMLRESGLNIDSIESDLKETTGIVAKNLLAIVKSGAPKIKIDNRLHYIGNDMADKYLETVKVGLLTGSSDATQRDNDMSG